MKMLTQQIGVRIRTARKSKNLSQHDLGKLTNLDQGYISRLENGTSEGTPTQLYEIAKAIKISITDLIVESIPAQPKNKIRITSAKQIIDDENSPTGLKELAADKSLARAISITGNDFHTLSSIDLPCPINKDAYVQLLIAIRAAVASGNISEAV